MSKPGGMLTFNINDGYLDGLLRGYSHGILRTQDYANLVQCEILDDLRLHLAGTDYGDFLADEPSPLETPTIARKITEEFVKQFEHIRSQAVEPLSKFLDYITYSYMIDNVVLLILGTLRERETSQLLEKCHPLGTFDAMASLTVGTSATELYNQVLIDTPLAPYFEKCLSEEDLDEMNVELIRLTLQKEYLQDFYKYCLSLGGITSEIMSEILMFEADRRAINITLNSLHKELDKDEREKLFPEFGHLYPDVTSALARCETEQEVYQAMRGTPYENLFAKAEANSDKSLDDFFAEEEVALHKSNFDQQFHYGIFYSYIKLREQEQRNIVWIAECVQQQMKSRIHDYVPIF